MNKKERLEALILHRPFDRVPWTMYKSLPPWGQTELDLRNRGLSMIYQHFPICHAINPEIRVSEKSDFLFGKNHYGKNIILREFTTPLGKVTVQHEFFIDSMPGPGDLIQKFGSDTDQECLSWVTKHPFTEESDYNVLEFIYKNTTYIPNYTKFLETEKLIGSEGVIMANVGKSPFQILLYELMGYERVYYEVCYNSKKFFHLYDLLCQKQEEKYKLAADSPAQIIWAPENLTYHLTPPEYYKDFCLNFYNSMAEILHARGKTFAAHMDGLLKQLAGLIGESKLDIIEAFTPPPMGDLRLKEARALWGDRIIWINFPGNLLAYADKKTIKEYTVGLLKEIAPGDNYILGCTENYPFNGWKAAFEAIADVLNEHGGYPVSI